LQAQAGAYFFYENVTADDNDYCTPGSTVNNCPNQDLWTLQDSTIAQQKNDAEAIFGSVDYAVTPDFKATAGVRLTQDHKTFATLYSDTVPPPSPPAAAAATATNVSWDVSGTYSITRDLNAYARIATGFRAPSFGTPSAGLPIQVARSEKNISYETGIKADLFDHRAQLSFDVYYYDVKGQQLTAVGGGSNDAILLNAQKTVGKGSELEFDFHPVSFVTLNLSGSYNDTRIEDPTLEVGACAQCTPTNPVDPKTGLLEINGNPLPQAAKWVGDAGVRVEQPLSTGKVYAYTDISTRSSMNPLLYTSKEFTLAPLTQVGLRLGYDWGGDKYDVAAFCRNCANQIRVIGAIDFDDLTGYINDPRVFGASFRARF
jgi:iron complex outermembrane receptor protein